MTKRELGSDAGHAKTPPGKRLIRRSGSVWFCFSSGFSSTKTTTAAGGGINSRQLAEDEDKEEADEEEEEVGKETGSTAAF